MVRSPVNPLHCLKAHWPIDVTESGMVRLPVSPEHPWNVALRNNVKPALSGRVRVPLNPEQPENASLPMDVTESGMARLPVNPEQPENAELPIDVTDEGMVRVLVM